MTKRAAAFPLELFDPRASFRMALVAPVRVALATLLPRERRVIEARFGFGCAEHRLKDVGAEFGVTGARIRQIEQKAIRKLRRHLKRPA